MTTKKKGKPQQAKQAVRKQRNYVVLALTKRQGGGGVHKDRRRFVLEKVLKKENNIG